MKNPKKVIYGQSQAGRMLLCCVPHCSVFQNRWNCWPGICISGRKSRCGCSLPMSSSRGERPCQWQFDSFRVSFKIAHNHPPVRDETSCISDLDDEGQSKGYKTGRAKEASGDLDSKTHVLPMTYISHKFNETIIGSLGDIKTMDNRAGVAGFRY